MISSMTAFARDMYQTELGTLTVEMRALNYRYLDLHINMPDNWDCFISDSCRILKEFLMRGRVECRGFLQPTQDV